jgi:hypothetical protein
MSSSCTYGACKVSASYDVTENEITTGEFDAKSGEPIRTRDARRIIAGSAYCLRHARKMAAAKGGEIPKRGRLL